MRMVVFPDETNPPLVVDADRMLALSVAFQSFEPISRRHAQIVDSPGIVQETQFAKRGILDVGRQPPAAAALPNRSGLGIPEAGEHYLLITHNVMRYKNFRFVLNSLSA
jgi:hypothetical protein